jgi:solute carrier family 7 (L-type amino acid transporter), member 5
MHSLTAQNARSKYLPSFFLQCFLTLVLLVVGDVYVLIDYLTFVESLFITMSISGLLWLRIKRPNALRPIKVRYFLHSH